MKFAVQTFQHGLCLSGMRAGLAEFITFTARFDGSSKFGSQNKYGFFPSGAFAWKIDQEPFMKDIEEVNELKLRLSAGVKRYFSINW